MKMISKISWLLNLALIGALIYIWKTPRGQGGVSLEAVPARIEPETPAPAAKPVAVPAPKAVEAVPFRWNQLLSSNNYLTFVANLRSAGCPEATVEDIVHGDVERVFAHMRAGLKTNGTDPGTLSIQSQMRMAASLLGQAPPEAEAIVAETHSQQPAIEPASLAAFLQDADLTALGLDDEQKQQIANLRQSLLEQLSRANHASRTPAPQSSQVGMSNGQSSPTGTDGTQPSMAQTDDVQTGSGNAPQSSQVATAGSPPWWHPPSEELLMAEEEQSMLGGLFGNGAAAQYNQYQAAHQSPQD